MASLPCHFSGVSLEYLPERTKRPLRVQFRVPGNGRWARRYFPLEEKAAAEEWGRTTLAEHVSGVRTAKKADMETLLPEYIAELTARGNSDQYVAETDKALKDLIAHGLRDLGSDKALQTVQNYLRDRRDYKRRVALPVSRGRAFRVSRLDRVMAMVTQCEGNKRLAAAKLGMSEKTLHRWYARGTTLSEPREISKSTRNKILRAVSGLVTYALDTDRLMKDPFRALRKRRRKDNDQGDQDVPAVFSLDECSKLVNAPADVREDPFWLATMLYLYAGFRDREATWITWPQVSFAGKRILIRKATAAEKEAGKRVKRNKSRNARLVVELASILRSVYPGEGATGYVIADNIRTAANHHRNEWLAKLCHRVGIDIKDRTLHSLRHTNASLMEATGLGPLALRDHLGHSKVDMSAHYAQNADVMREQVKHWPQGEFCFMTPSPAMPEASKTLAPAIAVKASASHITFSELDFPHDPATTTKHSATVSHGPEFSGELDWPDKEKDAVDVLLADPELIVIEEEVGVS